MKKIIISNLVLIAIGFVLYFLISNYVANVEPMAAQHLEDMSDLQKESLSVLVEMNKLLISLSLLAIGAIGSFILNKNEGLQSSKGWVLSILAMAMLFSVISIYCGYELYSNILEMLSNEMFEPNNPLLAVPLKWQFASFILSVVSFAFFIWNNFSQKSTTQRTRIVKIPVRTYRIKAILILCISLFSFSARSQEFSREDIVLGGQAKFGFLTEAEVSYIRESDPYPVIRRIIEWDKGSSIKLSKNTIAELTAEFLVSELSIRKFAQTREIRIEDIRSLGMKVLPTYLNQLASSSIVNDLVCFWGNQIPRIGSWGEVFYRDRNFYRYPPNSNLLAWNDLGPTRANDYGFVQFKSNVEQGAIAMDGTAQYKYTDITLVVLCGQRKFTVSKTGYISLTKEIKVEKGKTDFLEFELKKEK